MSGIGQDGYGPGSGSSADYGYGSGASAFGSPSPGSRAFGSSPYSPNTSAPGSSSIPSTGGPYSDSSHMVPAPPASSGPPAPYSQPYTHRADPYAQPYQSQAHPYGAPQTMDPYAGAYPSTVVYSPPTNTMAILSLVFSLAGIVTSGVTCIVGIILGHIARNQIKQTGEQGAGLALAGLLTGYGLIGLWVLGIIGYALFMGIFITALA